MDVNEFIAEWWGKQGGRERSNFSVFIGELCQVLGVEPPKRADAGKLGAYEYEGPVPGGSFRSLKGTGAIDLYKRGHFIMEAKQSYLKSGDTAQRDLDLGAAPQAPSGARYDTLMRDARRQVENYARYLPASEPVAPFLIVCDIGRAFELYVDTAGNGRGYAFFPDRQSYRIELPDLASDRPVPGFEQTPLELLRTIWTAPREVDPRFHSAMVTRQVATNLAEVSRYLEEAVKRKVATEPARSAEIEETSLFLMRVLFCMFAEDIGLLPEGRFKDFLKRAEGNDRLFEAGLRDLFEKMNNANPGSRFAMAVESEVRYFNGGLFEDARVFPLGGFLIHNLYEAARQNWRRVEPAIFGTLLEQALDAEERKKLGAHYTPRPYVETLVRATILDVLEPEWDAIEELPEGEVLAAAEAFHTRLATLKVLDPACGTGNFLYVAMELLQALESRVIERIQTLGGGAGPLIGPHQFFGLELNPRAAKIAELVLWIGWLRNRLKDDPAAVPEPVLGSSANINFGRKGRYDAVLRQTPTGEPDLANPMIPGWPEADFIVGNPPFIAGQDMREELTGEYAEALWKANPRVGGSADFVMQWWDRAAHTLVAPGSKLRRFGFVTTNSITQTFSRRVIEGYLAKSLSPEGEGGASLSLIFAIPDHPWIKPPASQSRGRGKNKGSGGPAAVRIAMTVAQAGNHLGQFVTTKSETQLDSDTPQVDYHDAVMGRINADLSTGTDVTKTVKLVANVGICHDGVKLHGKGFSISRNEAAVLGLGSCEGLEKFVRPYRNGKDLAGRNPASVADKFVIDLFGLDEKQVRQQFRALYQHILLVVKPERDRNSRQSYRDLWWVFGEPRREMRPALNGLARYIGTVDTAKHRVFQFVPAEVLCDDKVVIVADDHPFVLGVLSSSISRRLGNSVWWLDWSRK